MKEPPLQHIHRSKEHPDSSLALHKCKVSNSGCFGWFKSLLSWRCPDKPSRDSFSCVGVREHLQINATRSTISSDTEPTSPWASFAEQPSPGFPQASIQSTDTISLQDIGGIISIGFVDTVSRGNEGRQVLVCTRHNVVQLLPAVDLTALRACTKLARQIESIMEDGYELSPTLWVDRLQLKDCVLDEDERSTLEQGGLVMEEALMDALAQPNGLARRLTGAW